MKTFLESGCILSAGPNSFWIGRGPCVQSSEPRPEGGPEDSPKSTPKGLPKGLPKRLNEKWSLYAPDFFLEDPQPWRTYADWSQVTFEELCFWLNPISSKKDSSSSGWTEFNRIPPNQKAFASSFQSLKGCFSNGTLQKGVPVVFERYPGTLSHRDRARLLLELLQKTRGLPVWIYGVWDEVEGGILGATPELLFQFGSRTSPNGNTEVELAALAGTRLKSTSGADSDPLLQDPKEREEHQWVIQGIVSALSELGEVRVGETGILELPTLFHLHTPIRLRWGDSIPVLEARRFEKLIQQLHPTPALGAFPKSEGWRWLKSQRGSLSRKRFGAPFGIFKDGESPEALCVVGIRNIQWDSEQILIGAGCGVVQASVLEKEWAEVLGKIESVKKLFGIDSDSRAV